jgi:uncharacterized protein (TIGR02117 family)
MKARLVGVVIAVSLALAGLALVVPRPLVADADGQAPGLRRILVLANPIHTDIALPPDADVVARFGFLASDGLPLGDPGVGWILFGWGGRSFYIETPSWAELKAAPLLKALTVDASVMHVALAGPIAANADGVLAVDLAPEQFERLLVAIEETFRRGGNGLPLLVPGRSYGEFDLFYEASGRFNALVGCNTWTARVLRAAGLRTSVWSPLPQSLVWSLGAFNDLPDVATP